jgi:hypothetical protein
LWKGQLLSRGKEEVVDVSPRPKQGDFPPRAMYQEGTAMSADDRFDELSKTLAASTSRRRFLKVAAAAAAAGVLSVVGAPEAAASHRKSCRESGDNCRSDAECCTHFCGSGHCACAVNCPGATTGTGAITTECCAPGDVCCGGKCLKQSQTLCSGGKVFNTATCQCEEPAGTTVPCGTTACRAGEICCRNTVCCPTSTPVCCPTGMPRCRTALTGPGGCS